MSSEFKMPCGNVSGQRTTEWFLILSNNLVNFDTVLLSLQIRTSNVILSSSISNNLFSYWFFWAGWNWPSEPEAFVAHLSLRTEKSRGVLPEQKTLTSFLSRSP